MPVIRLHLRLLIIFVMMIFSIVGLTSTAIAQPADTDTDELIGTQWQLVSSGEPDDQTSVIEDSGVTLVFRSNTQIEGYGGCNGYGGTYSVEDDSITFSEVISTLMACEEGGVTEQEAAYFSALNSAERYEITDDELVIVYVDGQELHFTSDTPLLNIEWQLVSYGEPDELTDVIGDSTLTLNFAADDTVNGNGGCNGYGGNYTIEDDTLTISEIVSTMMACADDAATQQESAFFQALQAATRYEVNEGELTIWYGDDEAQLHFVAVEDSLVGSSWQLISYGDTANPTTAVIQSSATLSFNTETEISGNTGCNGFGGSYEVDGTSITFNSLIQTEMACEGVMEQEQAYIAGLTSATDYERVDDQLTISYPEGELNFVLIADSTTSTEAVSTDDATGE